MTTLVQYQAKIERDVVNMDRYNDFINGPVGGMVVVDSGAVKNLRTLASEVTVQIGRATSEADRAAASAQTAQEAEEGALAAVDMVTASAQIYATVAGGLAAVANGQYFRVVGSDSTFVSLYRKVDGAAVFVNDMLSANGVLDAIPSDNLHDFPGTTDTERLAAALAEAATRPMRLRLAAGRGLFAGDVFVAPGAYLFEGAFVHPGTFPFEMFGDGIVATVLYFRGPSAGFEYRGTYAGSRAVQNEGRIRSEFFGVHSLRALHNSPSVLPHIFFANFKQQPSTIARQVDIHDIRIEPATTLRGSDPRNLAGYNMTCLNPIHIRNAWFPRVERFLVTFRIDYGNVDEQDSGTAGVFLEGLVVGADIAHAQITTARAAVKVRPRRIFGINGSVTGGVFNRGDTITQGTVTGKVVEPIQSGASYGYTLAVDDVEGGAFTTGPATGQSGATINITAIANIARPSESLNLSRLEMVSCDVGFDVDCSYPEGSATFPQGYGLLYNISRCHANIYTNAVRARGVTALTINSGCEFESRRQVVEHIWLDYSASSLIEGNFIFGFVGGAQSGIRTLNNVTFMVQQGNVFASMEKTLRLSPTTSESVHGPSVYGATTGDHIVNTNPTNRFVGGGDTSLGGLNSLSDQRRYLELVRGDGSIYMRSVNNNLLEHSPNPMHTVRLAADNSAPGANTSPIYQIVTNANAADPADRTQTYFVTPNGRTASTECFECPNPFPFRFAGDQGIFHASASPEGAVAARAGSVCFSDNGTAWLKVSGSGATGWRQIALVP